MKIPLTKLADVCIANMLLPLMIWLQCHNQEFKRIGNRPIFADLIRDPEPFQHFQISLLELHQSFTVIDRMLFTFKVESKLR